MSREDHIEGDPYDGCCPVCEEYCYVEVYERQDQLRAARYAFDDALIALTEIGRGDVADTLAARWNEVLLKEGERG